MKVGDKVNVKSGRKIETGTIVGFSEDWPNVLFDDTTRRWPEGFCDPKNVTVR